MYTTMRSALSRQFISSAARLIALPKQQYSLAPEVRSDGFLFLDGSLSIAILTPPFEE